MFGVENLEALLEKVCNLIHSLYKHIWHSFIS
jgi:hypothetical protein